MTKRVVDISDYQAGLDVDALAAAVDGAWCKVGDWAWVARYGWPADDIHDAVVNRFLALGKPVGSYLFVRPGWTDPATQIDGWRAHCPDCTVAPMIDLEVPGTLSGPALRDWVDAALVRAAQVFGMVPVLYWSNAFARAYGMTAPAAPHIPMVAEYHWGYQSQLWQDVNSWETHAYSAYGGPDVPPGYDGSVTSRSLIWQWTSSAQFPGPRGLVDCDLVPDAAWQQITDASLPPASVDDIEEIMADPALSAALAEFLRQFGPGGPYYLADVYNRTSADHPAVQQIAKDTNVAQYGWKRLDGSPADTLALWTLGLHERMTAQSLNPIAKTTSDTLDAVNKLAAGGVDVDQLVARIVAGVVASGIKADVDKAALARAVRLEFALALAPPPPATVPPSVEAGMALSDELPDPNPERRAAVALADLATSIFDSDTGVAAVVSRQLANMRPAPGVEVSNDDIAGAIEGALADAANRAGVKAASLPPLPPLPVAGDMGGEPAS